MSVTGREARKGRQAILEIPITAKQFAADWTAKRILSYDRIDTQNDGLRILAETPKGRRNYLIIDILSPLLDNSKQLEASLYDSLGNAIPTFTVGGQTVLNRHTAVAVVGGVTLAVGTTVGLAAGTNIQTGIGNGAGQTGAGRVVAPVAGAVITSVTTALAAQNYLVFASTDLGPGFLTADVGNMGYTDGTLTISGLARGINGPFRVNIPNATTVSINAVANATAGVAYVATLCLIPVP